MRYFVLVCYAFVTACSSGSTAPTSKDSTTASASEIVQADTAAAIVTPSCYAHQTSNNLILLKLTSVRPNVSGNLTYDIMGKDKNEGTISGTMHGDTLFADYNFKYEGKQSVRQVAFLRKGNSFVEGYRDLKQKGDSTVFSDADTLSFNGTIVLTEVPCTYP